jgi:phage terminase large subunit
VRIEGAENAIDDGVSCVADKFFIRKVDGREPYAKLYVDPSCKNLIRELGLYRRKRDPRNRERVLDDIQDKDNHAADSIRYALMTRFGKPLATRQESGGGW